VDMRYVLVAAIGAASAIAIAQNLSQSAPAVARDANPPLLDESAAEAPAGTVDSRSSGVVEGQVLEVLQVPKYTYLRLGAKGTEGTWTAVATAAVELGSSARVRGAIQMAEFTSTALKRSFPVIYFGTLDEGRGQVPREPSAAAQGSGPQSTGRADDAHPTAAVAPVHAPLGPVAVTAVERASGPNGRTVAEVVARRTELAGKTVRIHATVVKSTPGVLGRTYLHVRDGSGDAGAGTHDVAVTTSATPVVGDIIVLEGVVAIDRDLGSGYTFPIIVEDATIVGAP
jgi:hypothetical protein